jgi:hypothetical protein
MDAAEREEHRRYQAELVQLWARWDRRAKWRIRLDIAISLSVILTILLLTL